ALAGGVDLLAWHRQHVLVDIGAARSGCDRVIGGAGVDQIAQCADRGEHERAAGAGHAGLSHQRPLPRRRAATSAVRTAPRGICTPLWVAWSISARPFTPRAARSWNPSLPLTCAKRRSSRPSSMAAWAAIS